MQGYYADLLNDDHSTKDPVPSGEFNSHARILNSQLVGALQAIGAGCAETDAWKVTAGSGLSVDISAGTGIARDGTGFVLLQTTGSYHLQLPANATRAVYALAVVRQSPGEPDSRESGVVQFHTNATGGEVSGAVLIATVSTGSSGVTTISDERSFVRALEALEELAAGGDDLEAIREALGTEYFGNDPPPSVDARLDDLEAAGANEGEGPVYWGQLAEAAGDPTTIAQHVDAEMQEHVDALHGDGGSGFTAEAEPWDEDSVNQGRHVLRATRVTDNLLPDCLLDTVVLVWGIYGDGSSATPDYVDDVNSTWLPTP